MYKAEVLQQDAWDTDDSDDKIEPIRNPYFNINLLEYLPQHLPLSCLMDHSPLSRSNPATIIDTNATSDALKKSLGRLLQLESDSHIAEMEEVDPEMSTEQRRPKSERNH
ncbi:unnamed protein product [Orchesella dallaii]|uniref:Uncharacterized protein n=1 Tax=Orchesella dallaii TaxID=48710 RepID=A0ABP1RS22_9HEXA